MSYRWELVDLREKLPCPVDGFLLEVVRKGPVPHHLEERMVVGVLSNIIQIVVLSSSADALLAVGHALQRRKRSTGVDGASEDWLELVHASVGKQQRGVIVRHHWGGLVKRVFLLLDKEIHVLLAYT